MDIACPQCGNPHLEVDEANSVVYCPKCGFAVKVDPQTGKVTPISKGGAPTPPPVYSRGGGGREILGMDALTFFMAGTALGLLLTFTNVFDLTIFAVLEAVLFYFYWTHK
jgi:hypothetical protein